MLRKQAQLASFRLGVPGEPICHSVPVGTAAYEDNQPQKLHQGDGQGGYIGQSRGAKHAFHLGALAIGQNTMIADGRQGAGTGVEFGWQGNQLEQGEKSKAGNAGLGEIREKVAHRAQGNAEKNQRHGQL